MSNNHMHLSQVLGKQAVASYMGLANSGPSTMPMMQPNVVPQPLPQQAPNGQVQQNATPTPSTPSLAAQAGGGRQQRGYNNTPLKQNSGTPGSPGRPPAGKSKSAKAKSANAYCGPSVGSSTIVPVTRPMSGMGPAKIGMPPPPMTNMGTSPPLKLANHPSCCKKRKDSSQRNKSRMKKSNFDEKGLPTVSHALSNAPLGAATAGLLGGNIGGVAGLLAGLRRGNVVEGVGRGALRGSLTGAGASLGGNVGYGLGSLIGHSSPLTRQLGALAGAGLGGATGWLGSGRLLGERSKEKDKTDQEKGKEEKRMK